MLKFSRSHRLIKKSDFQSVFEAPHKLTFKYLVALYRPNLLPHARLGVILAKKHIKLAVDRNRVRRLIREGFRHHQETLKGLDIIILLRSECTAVLRDKITLRDDIRQLWKSLEVRQKS